MNGCCDLQNSFCVQNDPFWWWSLIHFIGIWKWNFFSVFVLSNLHKNWLIVTKVEYVVTMQNTVLCFGNSRTICSSLKGTYQKFYSLYLIFYCTSKWVVWQHWDLKWIFINIKGYHKLSVVKNYSHIIRQLEYNKIRNNYLKSA